MVLLIPASKVNESWHLIKLAIREGLSPAEQATDVGFMKLLNQIMNGFAQIWFLGSEERLKGIYVTVLDRSAATDAITLISVSRVFPDATEEEEMELKLKLLEFAKLQGAKSLTFITKDGSLAFKEI